jgi:hypothetical protein
MGAFRYKHRINLEPVGEVYFRKIPRHPTFPNTRLSRVLALLANVSAEYYKVGF